MMTDREKRVVVGIDAAWTSAGSSGVAIVEVTAAGAELVAAAPSYAAFCDLKVGAEIDWRNTKGGPFDAADILGVSARLTGRLPDVIAIDMPLSTETISRRRVADNLVSSAFGAMGAGTHSPSEQRPGAHGQRLQGALEKEGYVLQTNDRYTDGKRLIEVYPHPALIRLCESDRRLPYKASKCSKYWPGVAAADRRKSLLQAWEEIAERLEGRIAGSRAAVSEAIRSCRAMKSVEDVIDAIVCAWVGVCFSNAEATSFGDSTAAIWIPAHPAGGRLDGAERPESGRGREQ